jgi:hypothetical protein
LMQEVTNELPASCASIKAPLPAISPGASRSRTARLPLPISAQAVKWMATTPISTKMPPRKYPISDRR